ncbi:MAG TPA: hypothetical protein EYG03_12100 [Planctomycetes bacterium]|nr:hypothetical protein [Fuerstiella sp.]HIK92709.1 hypothetical protein [Planctomycetota bacterium]
MPLFATVRSGQDPIATCRQIEEMVVSKVSMMPRGLLNTLQQDELLDLMAYLLSRGDRNHPMFLE